MPATIVVGGQYGSEGKGKVAALLAREIRSPWLVRCGGPNSGHTVTVRGQDIVLRQVPCCTEPSLATFCVAAGCVIDEPVLLGELDVLGIRREQIIIDPRAMLVTEDDRKCERGQLIGIGSTCSGTGAALIRRIERRSNVRLAKDSSLLTERCRIETVAPLLHDALDRGEGVIVEGTQGFALSLLHGRDYPFVTARDTTAAGFAMEVGLSPRLIDRIVLVLRTFPIRVGGPSGPFANECTWEDIREQSGAPRTYPEYTSVTRRLRRVARFDMDSIVLACKYNRPTDLAVMGLDRLDYADSGVCNATGLTATSRDFLNNLELTTGVPVAFAGTGFGTLDFVRFPDTAPTQQEPELNHARY
ncbi:adenylosuccinate synthetase [Paludibaculum fermentans]|uniref:adenylosuccinate synthetase n=1 Tax=Paludibaculum fermentans TaxID=1473598 RepID=UPI003EB85063